MVKQAAGKPEIKIKRQKRKSLSMRLTYEGFVVSIPHWMNPSDRRVKAFIEDGLKKFAGYTLPERIQHNTQAEIREMVAQWAAVMGLQPGRVTFRKMYTRWGSCSSRGNVSLNAALCYVPRELAEYVVVHELVHLRVFNHGPDFKAMMTQYLPDWNARQKLLRQIPL